jgi:hypothetical protein
MKAINVGLNAIIIIIAIVMEGTLGPQGPLRHNGVVVVLQFEHALMTLLLDRELTDLFGFC